MRRTNHAPVNQAQLALIEVAPSPPRRVVDGARRQRQAAMNAHHCQVLLAELDRVANAIGERAVGARASADLATEQRVHDLAALYEACERAETGAPGLGAGQRSAAGSPH